VIFVVTFAADKGGPQQEVKTPRILVAGVHGTFILLVIGSFVCALLNRFSFQNLLHTVIREFCLNSHPAGQMSELCRTLRSW
jgi:hypothetical protein